MQSRWNVIDFNENQIRTIKTRPSNRFQISISVVSIIFATWVKGLSSILKHLLFMLEQGSLNTTKLKRFNQVHRIHSIIDGSEIFIETPKNLDLQKLTWSEYKHHNTVKILVAVTPNSSISFVSKTHPGSISDKKITNDSNFLSKVPPYSCIMADKGFNIQAECVEHNISLCVPPRKWGSYQMVPMEIEKTKQVANLRILVEQVIRQIKTFRILSQEFGISLLSSIDDIVIICCALCNLLPPIFKD